MGSFVFVCCVDRRLQLQVRDGLQELRRDGLLPAGPVLDEVSAVSHLVHGM